MAGSLFGVAAIFAIAAASVALGLDDPGTAATAVAHSLVGYAAYTLGTLIGYREGREDAR